MQGLGGSGAVQAGHSTCWGSLLLWGCTGSADTSPEPLVPGVSIKKLKSVPGIFAVLQAGGFFPLATQKMVFDLIMLPLFAFSCEVLV